MTILASNTNDSKRLLSNFEVEKGLLLLEDLRDYMEGNTTILDDLRVMINEDTRGIGLSRRGIHTAAFALSEKTDEMFKNENFVHNYNGVVGENLKKILGLKQQRLIVTDKLNGRYCKLEDAKYKNTQHNTIGKDIAQKNQIRLGKYFRLTNEGMNAVSEKRDELSNESEDKLSLIVDRLISSPREFITEYNKDFKNLNQLYFS